MMMMMIFLRYVTAGRKREREKYQSRRYIAHQRSAIQFCNWLTRVKHSITPPCVFCRVKNSLPLPRSLLHSQMHFTSSCRRCPKNQYLVPTVRIFRPANIGLATHDTVRRRGRLAGLRSCVPSLDTKQLIREKSFPANMLAWN